MQNQDPSVKFQVKKDRLVMRVKNLPRDGKIYVVPAVAVGIGLIIHRFLTLVRGGPVLSVVEPDQEVRKRTGTES